MANWIRELISYPESLTYDKCLRYKHFISCLSKQDLNVCLVIADSVSF